MDSNDIFITGYAKLPQGITAKELYTVIAVGIVIEKKSGVILSSDCSLATQLARDFVSSLIVGSNLNDIEYLESKFKDRYHGSARKAIISALRTCSEKYLQLLEDESKVTE